MIGSRIAGATGVALLGFAASAVLMSASRSADVAWEYQVVSWDGRPSDIAGWQQRLNALGAEGWELVTVTSTMTATRASWSSDGSTALSIRQNNGNFDVNAWPTWGRVPFFNAATISALEWSGKETQPDGTETTRQRWGHQTIAYLRRVRAS